MGYETGIVSYHRNVEISLTIISSCLIGGYWQQKLKHFVPYFLVVCCLVLLVLIINLYLTPPDQFLAIAQIYFEFGENTSDANYRTYENSTAGVQIRYPSNWNVLENIGNVSGNYILADFYLTGITGTSGYAENANIIVLNQSEYVARLTEEYLDTSAGSFAIQPTKVITDVSNFTRYLINESLDPTIANLKDTLGNVTLLQSIPTVISGSPGHEITYLISNNQSHVKQTQAWTIKDGKWFVVTYSAQPPAYYSPATAINIISSLTLS
jgi:hypothetical protein